MLIKYKWKKNSFVKQRNILRANKSRNQFKNYLDPKKTIHIQKYYMYYHQLSRIISFNEWNDQLIRFLCVIE